MYDSKDLQARVNDQAKRKAARAHQKLVVSRRRPADNSYEGVVWNSLQDHLLRVCGTKQVFSAPAHLVSGLQPLMSALETPLTKRSCVRAPETDGLADDLPMDLD
eukprot:1743523-Lingulodinium_polyedra.AAC.1